MNRNPDERNTMHNDVFRTRAARIAADHRAATTRAADEAASLFDTMRLAGFVFASDNRATVADAAKRAGV